MSDATHMSFTGMIAMSKMVCLRALALSAAIGSTVATAQTPIPPSPEDFVAAVAQSDQYEIMAGQLAMVQGQDPRVRSFAETMIQDHTRLAKALREAAAAAMLPQPPSGMSSDEAALLSGLQGLRGAEFDKAYARQQRLAHAQAAAVVDSFATSGADASLKTAAQAALPIIQEHQSMAKQLGADVGAS